MLRGFWMRRKLKRLLEQARIRVISDEERAAQRISFAYGNTKLSNDNITRELVEAGAQNVDRRLID